jgi:nucleoside-diphosphate-sugar epimerase
MKALVTGCAGFIGSSLVDRLLADNHTVIGIDCFTDYYPRSLKERNISVARKNPKFTFIEEDIFMLSSFPDVDVVFHQAAQAGVRASWGKSFTIYTHNNIDVTQKLLEWYKDHPVKKFVYASSSSVYGDTSLPMTETATPQPVSPYGVSKLAAEHLCYLYWKNYGVPTISLRYFTVYGPRQRPDMAINKFMHAITSGKSIVRYGDGSQTRDFTYVDDIVSANLLAAGSTFKGEVFNIGGGNRITLANLIALIESVTGKKAKIHMDSLQKGDVTDTWASTEKAKSKLHWKPRIDIQQGLKNYWEWMKAFER